MKILILDDDPGCLASMACYFSTLGHDPAVAWELEQAIALLANDAFDAVITDVRLSEMQQAEGLMLLQFIRERALELRVIVVTAYDLIHVRAEAIRLGAEHFLVKPVPLDHLAMLLDCTSVCGPVCR